MNTRRSLVRMSAALLAAGALSTPVLAQQFPVKPIRTIIPFTPGSTTDVIGRIVAEGLSASLGQPIIIENRSGAGGSVGSAVVARADADGVRVDDGDGDHAFEKLDVFEHVLGALL